MRNKREELEKSMNALRFELKEVIDEIEQCKFERDQLCDLERTLKERTTIKEGKREGDANILSALEDYDRKIKTIDQKINNIKKPHKEKFEKPQNHEKEWERIREKEHVYVVDVELDQLMTCFRMSFANLCSFFLSHCLNDEKWNFKRSSNPFSC